MDFRKVISAKLYQSETAFAVREIDAKIGNHLLVERGKGAIESDEVNLMLFKLRVGHFKGKITVVSQEEETAGILVEAADGF